MSFGGKYIRVVASLNNNYWELTVFQFITAVGADVLDEPLGTIDYNPILTSELDPFEFGLRPETVEVSITQPILSSFSLYNMVQNNDYGTSYTSHTKAGFFLEVKEISSGTTWYYKHRADQISRTINNNGTQQVKFTFYNGITEAENLKQWNSAGTSRNSAWTTIFQTGVYKTVRQYVEAICSGSVDSDFGSVSFSKRHWMAFVCSNSATVHGIDNIYLPGDIFLNGTSSSNALHKTGADVLKDLQIGFGMNIQWNGLNRLAFYQAYVGYATEEVYVARAGESINEDPLHFNSQGVVVSLKDQSATPKFVHNSFGTVYYDNNAPVDTKNTKQMITRIYNDLTGSSFSPAIGMFADDPIGGAINLYKIVTVNGYSTNGEALLNLLYAYDPTVMAFRQRKTMGLKTPTFANSPKVNFAGKIWFDLNPGGTAEYLTGKIYSLKRNFGTLLDEFDMYTYTASA
ncbi:MAG: hypothetical protein LCH54_15490 [Bacteroidetes bacterium]|nr:hypothetical protein [Bacteroidota bacterium]